MPQEKMNPPRVSVIMATFNRCEVLAECLATYQGQTYPNIEVVVVDNGSQDNTVAYVREHFPEVILLENTGSNGPEALNIAARTATGTYLWRTDDDAYPDAPTTIADAVAFLEQYPEVSVVVGDELARLWNYHVVQYYPFPQPAVIPPEGLPSSEFWGTVAMLRRDEFLRLGGFWDVFYFEELDLSTRIILDGGSIRYAPWIRVRHLQAFGQSPDPARRWLLRMEMATRYQFTYFPLPRAVGRCLLLWTSTYLVAIFHRLRPHVLFKGAHVAWKGLRTGRHNHVPLSRDEIRSFTFGRSMWNMVFDHYAVRWRERKTKAETNT